MRMWLPAVWREFRFQQLQLCIREFSLPGPYFAMRTSRSTTIYVRFFLGSPVYQSSVFQNLLPSLGLLNIRSDPTDQLDH